MNRVLSFPQAHSCDDPAEAVSKRFCFSCIISISFLTLIIGYLMGSKRPTVVNFTIIKTEDEYSETLQKMITEEKKQPFENKLLMKEDEISTIIEHFNEHKFDKIFPVEESRITLTFKNNHNPDMIYILDGEKIHNSVQINNTSAYTIPEHADSVDYFEHSVKGTPIYANFGSEEDIKFLDNKGISFENHILILRIGKLPLIDTVHEIRSRRARGILFFVDPTYELKTCHEGITNDLHPILLTELQQVIFAFHKDDFVVQVINATIAKMLLSNLSNINGSPQSWHGSLNISYAVGPGFVDKNKRISLKSHFIKVRYTVKDIVAILRGSEEPDRYVVISTSRKSLLRKKNTKDDLEMFFHISKMLANLKNQKNWTPFRSLVFIIFDLDDTEFLVDSWLQNYMDIFQQRTVAHLKIGHDQRIETEKSSAIWEQLAKVTSNKQNSNKSINFSNLEKFFVNQNNFRVSCYNNDQIWTEYDYHCCFLEKPTVTTSILKEVLNNFDSLTTKENMETVWIMLGFSLSTKQILPFNFTSYFSIIRSYNDFLTNLIINETRMDNFTEKFENFRQSIENITEVVRGFRENLTSNKEKIDSPTSRIINDKLMQIEKLFHCILSTYKHAVNIYPGFLYQQNKFNIWQKGQTCADQIIFLIQNV